MAACDSILDGDISPFINLILTYHKSKSFRSFREYNETAFQTAVELMLPANYYIPEMRLVTGYSNRGNAQYGFVDIFICDNFYGDRSIIIELKCIPLVGLYSGDIGNVVSNPDFGSLKQLDIKLQNESEDILRGRTYFYYSKEEKKYKSTTVQKTIDDGLNQINKYKSTVQNGKSRKKKPGILDDNIVIEDNIGRLGGYLIVTLGSQRIITETIKFIKIDYNFLLS